LGVNFKDLIPKTPITLNHLSGKVVAIDAFNAIYQFLSSIRQPDGTPLKNSSGQITSHLNGLFYRTSKLVEFGIKPVYVFDGTAPTLKHHERTRRDESKAEAATKYQQASNNCDTANMMKYAQASTIMKPYIVPECKKLLSLMGIPIVQAPSEGEAQAAYMARKGTADYCASQDYDAILCGAPKLLRNLNISGKRKIPNKNAYTEITPEVIDLNSALIVCKLSYEQLVDLGILIGTDFNDSIKGIGPKTALKLIKQHGSIENILPNIKAGDTFANLAEIRSIFTNPQATDDYTLEWHTPDEQALTTFLCSDKEFDATRIKNGIDRMLAGTKQKPKSSLNKWFG